MFFKKPNTTPTITNFETTTSQLIQTLTSDLSEEKNFNQTSQQISKDYQKYKKKLQRQEKTSNLQINYQNSTLRPLIKEIRQHEKLLSKELKLLHEEITLINQILTNENNSVKTDYLYFFQTFQKSFTHLKNFLTDLNSTQIQLITKKELTLNILQIIEQTYTEITSLSQTFIYLLQTELKHQSTQTTTPLNFQTFYQTRITLRKQIRNLTSKLMWRYTKLSELLQTSDLSSKFPSIIQEITTILSQTQTFFNSRYELSLNLITHLETTQNEKTEKLHTLINELNTFYNWFIKNQKLELTTTKTNSKTQTQTQSRIQEFSSFQKEFQNFYTQYQKTQHNLELQETSQKTSLDQSTSKTLTSFQKYEDTLKTTTISLLFLLLINFGITYKPSNNQQPNFQKIKQTIQNTSQTNQTQQLQHSKQIKIEISPLNQYPSPQSLQTLSNSQFQTLIQTLDQKLSLNKISLSNFKTWLFNNQFPYESLYYSTNFINKLQKNIQHYTSYPNTLVNSQYSNLLSNSKYRTKLHFYTSLLNLYLKHSNFQDTTYSKIFSEQKIGLPSVTTLSKNHNDAIDIFYKFKNPFSTKGPQLCALTGGIVLCAKDNWKGNATIQGYKSGGLSLKSGNCVIIYNPIKKQFYYYAHLHSILVKQGDIITSGTPIGYGGNTGLNAKKIKGTEHLHFEIHSIQANNQIKSIYIDELYKILAKL